MNNIEYNKTHYKKEIEQLDIIVKHDQSAFVNDMHRALTSNRKITKKMINAIHDIIRRNDVKNSVTRKIWLQEFLAKIRIIKNMLDETTYMRSYKLDMLMFIESLETQAKDKMKLSNKQMESLNKIYKKLKKRLERE